MDDNEYKNKKSQAPSYCDRILFKNNTAGEQNIHFYTCNDEIMGSDHRPVYLGVTIKKDLAHKPQDETLAKLQYLLEVIA
jgi:hypothetical protein